VDLVATDPTREIRRSRGATNMDQQRDEIDIGALRLATPQTIGKLERR
jgi:hypothetical protein